MIQNDEVEEYLRAVEGAARTAAVTAERGLRWISEADSVALYAYLGRLMRWAMRTGEMRVLWNRILVLGRCRCGAESVRPWWTGCLSGLETTPGWSARWRCRRSSIYPQATRSYATGSYRSRND